MTNNPYPLHHNLYDYKDNNTFNNIKEQIINNENVYSYNNDNIKGTRVGPIINNTYETMTPPINHSEI
jgi:hypothetical protein